MITPDIAATIFGGLNAVGLTLFGLYLRSMKKDQHLFMTSESQARQRMHEKIEGMDEKITSLKNGCFERHAKIERELGRNENTLHALHRRLDEVKHENIKRTV